jgi:hypothetical protein
VLRRHRIAGEGQGGLSRANVDAEFLADQLMMPAKEAQQGLERAIAAGLLAVDAERVVIVGWAEEWGRQPLTEAERKSRQRARQRDGHGESRTCPDTNVTVTDNPDCHGSDQIRSDPRSQIAREELHTLSTDDAVDRIGTKAATERAGVTDLAAALLRLGITPGGG